MFKNKALLLVISIVFLFSISNNISYATESPKTETFYPDYSCEFSGIDTCEKFNRKLFVFNLKLNRRVIRPVNIVWASVMPKYGMDRIKNAYNNVNFPVRFASCLFQKDFKASKQELVRFITNTTIGVGGLYDPALTRFKIEPCNEDLAQALAKTKIKRGPYLVLPIVRGNVRDLVGKVLDWPFKPTSYVGPFGAAANALFAVNNTTCSQPLVKKVDDSFADPYVIAKQIDGIDRYIKNTNLDRSSIFKEKTKSQNIINVCEFSQSCKIEPDIKLVNFNPQGSLVDSTRTAFFDNQKLDDSIWSEMSIWNKCFNKVIKTTSVKIYPNRSKYNYRYLLNKDKNSPLAILYPSFGEGIGADKSTVLAKILYSKGYSIAILGSAFQWEFIKSMPENYKPGLPTKDAQKLRLTTAKILEDIKIKKGRTFDKKIIIGCSYGALTGAFATAQDDKEDIDSENKLNITKYIGINPPVDILYAMRELDKYSQDWKKDPSDLKERTAIAAEKTVLVANSIYKKELKQMPENMPYTNDEAKMLISFIMKQKLYDVIFAIENSSRSKKSGIENTVNKMSFNDYAQNYLHINDYDSTEKSDCDTSLYSIENDLKTSDKYKIYHTVDDYFVNQEQLEWLKNVSNDKTILFSNGSHLGYLYRKEFLDQFEKDINLEKPLTNGKL